MSSKADNFKIIKKETLRHKEAFEYFYGMGDSRSVRRVAEEFRVSYKAVQQWYVSFGWKERVSQRDVHIGKKLEEKMVDTIINEKANYRKLIKLAISKLVDEMRNGNLNYNIRDLDRLIRLDMYLLGENDSSVKIENNHSLSDFDREAVMGLGKGLSSLVDELGEA